MHLSSYPKLAAVLTLSAALVGAVPVPKHHRARAVPLPSRAGPVHRRDVLERLQARSRISASRRAPEVATIHQFTRADGSNACIDGALDWIVSAAAGSGSSTSDPSTPAAAGTNSTNLPFVDACISDVIDWAVSKLVAAFNTTQTGAPSGGLPGLPGSPPPSAVSSQGPAPSASGSPTDPSAPPSGNSTDPGAPSASGSPTDPSAPPSGNSTDPGAPSASGSPTDPSAGNFTDPAGPASAAASGTASSPSGDGSSGDDGSSGNAERRSAETPRTIDPLHLLLGRLLSKFPQEQ